MNQAFQSENEGGVPVSVDLSEREPHAEEAIEADMTDEAGKSQVRGRQAVIDRSRTLIDKRRAELRLRIDEARNGPQGEARSMAIVQRVEMVPLTSIQEDPRFTNVRLDASETSLLELAESMKHEGLKVPIIVIPAPGKNVFYIRAGFRRTKVARMLRWKQIAAIVLPHDTPVVEEYWINIIENSARSRLSTYEIAMAARTMRDNFRVKPSEFAMRAGFSESYIANLLRCLDRLPEEVLKPWRQRQPIPVESYIAWSRLEPDEAIKMMLTFTNRNPRVVGTWKPDPETRLKVHPIKMVSSQGLARMQRVRFAIEVARSLDERTRDLCVRIVDFCSGARHDLPGIYDPERKQRIYKSRRRQDLPLPMPDEDEGVPEPSKEDVEKAMAALKVEEAKIRGVKENTEPVSRNRKQR